jgi:hypothetical protein
VAKLTKRTSAAEAAAIFSSIYGTAEAVPLSKTIKLTTTEIRPGKNYSIWKNCSIYGTEFGPVGI